MADTDTQTGTQRFDPNELRRKWLQLLLTDPICRHAASLAEQMGLPESHAWLIVAVFSTESLNTFMAQVNKALAINSTLF